MDGELLLKLNNVVKDIDELVEIARQIERQSGGSLFQYLNIIQAIKNPSSQSTPERVVRPGVKLGRPPGSKNKPKAAPAQTVAPVAVQKIQTLQAILTTLPKGRWTLNDCVKFAKSSNYLTSSSNFENLVYQKILKLVRLNLFKRYGEGQRSQYENMVWSQTK